MGAGVADRVPLTVFSAGEADQDITDLDLLELARDQIFWRCDTLLHGRPSPGLRLLVGRSVHVIAQPTRRRYPLTAVRALSVKHPTVTLSRLASYPAVGNCRTETSALPP